MFITYFVDSENVGDGWIDLLGKDESGKFLIFYTGNSKRIDYEHAIMLMNADNKPEFIHCYEGNNALDFQLVSYLGYLLCSGDVQKSIIVSNDTGYDSVVDFWAERGMNVKRMSVNSIINNRLNVTNSGVCEENAKDNENQSGNDCTQTDESAVHQTAETHDDNIFGIDKKELYTVINCIGRNNTAYIHLAFVHFYGSEKGQDIYNQMKKDKFNVPSVRWNKKTRSKKLCEHIKKYCIPSNVNAPDDLFSYLCGEITASDNKASMKKKLTKKYGNSIMQVNKILEPFYKILAQIKK